MWRSRGRIGCSLWAIDPALQVISEKAIHPMPCVVEHVLTSEVMKFARVHHERYQRTFPFFERFVDEPDGFKIGNVNVGCTVQYKQRTGETIDVGNGRRLCIDLWILLRTTDAALSPTAVIRVGIIHHIIDNSSHIDTGLEQRWLVGHRDQREEATIAEAPDADTIRVNVGQSLQVVC